MDTAYSFLRTHCFFKRLKDRELRELSRFSELLDCSSGAVVQYASEKAGALYIVMEGQLKDSSGKRLLPGDFFGMESLTGDSISESDVVCSVPSKLIKFTRQRFQTLLSRNSSFIKGLEPVYNEYDRLSSGIPEHYWSLLVKNGSSKKRKNKPLIVYKGRTSWKYLLIQCLFPVFAALLLLSFRDFIQAPPWFIPVATGLTGFVFLLPVIKRVFTVYMITGESVFLRQFRFRGFSLQSRQIPLDQVQGSEVTIKGLIRKVFGIGSLHIKNSAAEGSILFKNMDDPVKIQKLLVQHAEQRKHVKISSEQTELRKSVQEKMGADSGIRCLAGLSDEELGLSPEGSLMPDQVIFRKTPFVLLKKIFLPLLLICGLITLAAVFRDKYTLVPWLLSAGVALPSLLYILWHTIDWSNDLFMVEGGFVYDIDRKPLGKSEERKQIELNSAQNIMTDQKGFFSFLFNYGDVIVVTPGGVSDVKFETVSDPVWVQTLLFQLRENWKEKQKSDELAENLDDIIAVSRIIEDVKKRAAGVS